MRAFGIDISKWDSSYDGKTLYDFAKLRAHSEPVTFASARFGWDSYRDPRFDYYWQSFADMGIGRIAYWGTSLWRDAVSDATYLHDILADRFTPNDRLAFDAEVSGGWFYQHITAYILAFAQTWRNLTGQKIILYSRASWLNIYTDPPKLDPYVDWWLATYNVRQAGQRYATESPAPILPRGVTRWTIHQTGDKMPPIGSQQTFGDYDRWNGNADAVKAYFGQAGEVEPAPVEDGTPLYEATVTTSAGYRLRVRNAPNGALVRWLDSGATVNVYEEREA